jgi:hypothetical protein
VKAYIVPELMGLMLKMRDSELKRLGWRNRQTREEFVAWYATDRNRIVKYENLLLHFHPCYLKRPLFLMQAANTFQTVIPRKCFNMGKWAICSKITKIYID